MKCFNHEEREAAATCQRCGKGLCKECASKYTPCLCDDCYEAIQNEHHARQVTAVEQRRQGRLERMTFTRNDLVLNCVLGIPLVIFALYTIFTEAGGFSDPGDVLLLPWIFCVPAGWRITSKWLRLGQGDTTVIYTDADGALYSFVAHLMIRLIGGFFLGIPAFLFQLFKLARSRKAVQEAEQEVLKLRGR